MRTAFGRSSTDGDHTHGATFGLLIFDKAGAFK